MDFFALDGDNAFNMISRSRGLNEIRKHLPILLPLLKAKYGHSTHTWFYGLSHNDIKSIEVVEGISQGDIAATWMYCMAIHPFITGIKNILGTDGFVKFFIDDGNIGAYFQTMVNAIRYIQDEGPKYGFHMKRDKGSYLLGLCTTREEALHRSTVLVEQLGLNPNIIHIHPDNGSNSSSDDDHVRYGMNVLGCPIGSSQFIKLFLEEKLRKLSDVKNNLINFSHRQIKFLLLKKCFCPKSVYLMRLIDPETLLTFNTSFQSMKFDIFCNILGNGSTFESLSEITRQQILLPNSQFSPGFDLGDYNNISPAAYVASILACAPILTEYNFNVQQRSVDSNTTNNSSSSAAIVLPISRTMETFNACINQFLTLDPSITLDKIFQMVNKPGSSIQQQLTTIGESVSIQRLDNLINTNCNPNTIAWFLSHAQYESGLWLETIPKEDALEFSNAEFSSAVCSRLHLI